MAAIGGTEGSDILTGTFTGDHIDPRVGNDIVDGASGCFDVINGGSGDDVVSGGDGFGIRDGDTGSDRMHSDAGDNVVTGRNSHHLAVSAALRRRVWRDN